MKLVIGITAPLSVILLKGQLSYFKNNGYDVYLLAPKTNETVEFCSKEGAMLLPVPIEREINILSDIRSLFIIYRHLKKINPEIINVGTPKMGALGILAAKFLGISKRIYTCRGFRFEHEKGVKKFILKLIDKIALKSAQKVICISESVQELGIKEGMFTKEDTIIFGKGSSNGIDLDFFNPENYNNQFKEELKTKIGVSDKFIFGFVGRIIDRKGINELYTAFLKVNKKYPNSHLIIVGKANLEQVADKSLMSKLESDRNVTLTGYVTNVNDYMSIMDVFVLPAWWEGFGNTLIQAAAMGLPIISCNVTGCKDAVNHGFNGVLIPPKNITLLSDKMMEIIQDNDTRERWGQNGKEWAKNFDSEQIWSGLKNLYEHKFKRKILIVATSDIHLHTFHRPYIKWLINEGHEVDLAFERRGNYQFEEINQINLLDFPRELQLRKIVKSYKVLKAIIDKNKYDLVHCHTPIPSLISRMTARNARRNGCKVIYTAHGFHFHKNASLKEWLVYYPVEYIASLFTDAIIVLNKEDFERINGKMLHKDSFLIPGIGVDSGRFQPIENEEIRQKRVSLGYNDNDILVLYIAEFIHRKDHEFLIRCMPDVIKLNPNIKLLLAGKGILIEAMKKLTQELEISNWVDFLGFRDDIDEICKIIDIGVSTSRQEGKNIGLLEMRFCGKPTIASNIRGQNEDIVNGQNGYLFNSFDSFDFINKIIKLAENPQLRIDIGESGKETAKQYELENSLNAMIEIYKKYLN